MAAGAGLAGRGGGGCGGLRETRRCGGAGGDGGADAAAGECLADRDLGLRLERGFGRRLAVGQGPGRVLAAGVSR
ncbi:hypothetical protein CYR75_10050 [Paracoccus jeotgali]|uniref:Uncharacterized protein n=1 Tax=Paracoccus jeotgali TaxID=2065379 RepID=A0A2K9MG03_9RHOB|nr:hypothetical protein CYR75_10050 [Paracoccus jeotgali]